MKMNFIKPTSLRGGRKQNQDNLIYLNAFKKGVKRKGDCYEICLKNFIELNKLNWQYVAFAIESTGIYFTPVESTNEYGYFLSKHQKNVSNVVLVTTILKYLKKRIPMFPDDTIKILFDVDSLGNNIYQLKIK